MSGLREAAQSALSWLSSYPGGGALKAYDALRAALTAPTPTFTLAEELEALADGALMKASQLRPGTPEEWGESGKSAAYKHAARLVREREDEQGVVMRRLVEAADGLVTAWDANWDCSASPGHGPVGVAANALEEALAAARAAGLAP